MLYFLYILTILLTFLCRLQLRRKVIILLVTPSTVIVLSLLNFGSLITFRLTTCKRNFVSQPSNAVHGTAFVLVFFSEITSEHMPNPQLLITIIAKSSKTYAFMSTQILISRLSAIFARKIRVLSATSGERMY